MNGRQVIIHFNNQSANRVATKIEVQAAAASPTGGNRLRRHLLIDLAEPVTARVEVPASSSWRTRWGQTESKSRHASPRNAPGSWTESSRLASVIHRNELEHRATLPIRLYKPSRSFSTRRLVFESQ